MVAVQKGSLKHFRNEYREVDTGVGGPQLLKAGIMGRRASNMERYIEEGVWIEEGVKRGRDELRRGVGKSQHRKNGSTGHHQRLKKEG